MSTITRRSLLECLLAALAATALPSSAEAALDDDERQALIADIRQRAVGFDVPEFLARGLALVGLEKWIPEVHALFAGHEHARGLRSLHELGKDPTFGASASALMERMSGDLGTKLAVRRLAKRAPQTAEAQQALIDFVITDWFGLDLQRVRDHTASYPEGLLVVVGPPTDLAETLSSVGREPFIRYLELVHGYRAREWVTAVDEQQVLLEALVDPAVRVVAFVGHGTWTLFSLSGIARPPMDVVATVCRNVRKNPAKIVPRILANDARGAAAVGWTRGDLAEPDLAVLVAQLHPTSDGRLAVPKERVVRYTCGVGRYQTDATLLWELLPEALEAKVHVRDGSVSAEWPEDEGHWEEPLEAWLADKQVVFEDQPALGTCLVATPEDTRGYAGNSWLPDFVEDPIPAFRPGHPWHTVPEPPVVTSVATP